MTPTGGGWDAHGDFRGLTLSHDRDGWPDPDTRYVPEPDPARWYAPSAGPRWRRSGVGTGVLWAVGVVGVGLLLAAGLWRWAGRW